MGLLTSGVGVPVTLLSALGTLSFYLVAWPSLDLRVYAKSYCILLCSVPMISLGGTVGLRERGGCGEEKLWSGCIV